MKHYNQITFIDVIQHLYKWSARAKMYWIMVEEGEMRIAHSKKGGRQLRATKENILLMSKFHVIEYFMIWLWWGIKWGWSLWPNITFFYPSMSMVWCVRKEKPMDTWYIFYATQQIYENAYTILYT